MYKNTKNISFYLFLTFFFLFLFTDNAHAGYLDPGSGSSFVQGLISIFAFFGRIIDKIKRLFGFKKNSGE